jgi:alkylation response protein AidB-like acyl-CoA dehydrogenase
LDLEFSEEQEILRKSARAFMASKCSKKYVRDMEEDERGYSLDIWREMAKLGWMGLAFPEKYGGTGMSFIDLTVLLEEMGRACMPSPFFSTVILGGMTILDVGSEEQKQEFLPKIAEGRMLLTLGLVEPSGIYTPAGISIKAESNGNDYIINGTKLFVRDANVADYVICVARTNGGTSKAGITLFLVDTKSSGIACTMLRTVSSDKQAEVTFENIRVPKKNMVGELNEGWAGITKIIDRATVGKCAEMVGGAQQVLEMTVQYAKDRMQFSRPIGSFQVIQHYCADIITDVESSKLITYNAAWMLSKGLTCTKEVAMAKAWVSEAYGRVIALAHQIHGAVGFSKDHDLQLYSRRAKAAELDFGDADYHRESVAVEMGI